MRKIASIGFAIGALTVTALPVYAGDQQAQTPWRQYGTYWRAAPWLQTSPEAYAGFAQSGGYAQRSCTYIGGPKGSYNWTC